MSSKIPINKNGTLSTALEEVFVPVSSRLNRITNITFNNSVSSAYTVWLYLRDDHGTDKLMYKFELDADDHINDTIGYYVGPNTKLVAKSDVSTVDWTINGIIED